MKFFLPYHILFVLLLLVEGTLLLPTMRGDVCSEDLGPCGDDATCKSKCQAAHPDKGTQGNCDASSHTCKCFFQCDPPQRKECSVGIGPCSAACNAKCCDENCAAKFPGPMEGHGLCYEIGAQSYCVCKYICGTAKVEQGLE